MDTVEQLLAEIEILETRQDTRFQESGEDGITFYARPAEMVISSWIADLYVAAAAVRLNETKKD